MAVGGDGTVNECASALVGKNTILGLIPMGSGNGLARDLGIPGKISKSLQVINCMNTRAIDCGLANGNYFFCTAGVGFDAEVSQKFHRQKIRGFRGYIKTAFRELLRYQNQIYRIRMDATEIEEMAFSITLANACQFGNNAIIAPQADPGDGLIDLCVIKDFPKYQAISLLNRLFNGTIHNSPYSKIYRVKEVNITCPAGSHYHLDGETKKLTGETINVKVIPEAVKVLVPSK